MGLGGASGCRSPEVREAEERLRALAARPGRLERPVIFIHGWLDRPRRFRKSHMHIPQNERGIVRVLEALLRRAREQSPG
jgi:hypothetical protein